MKLLLDDAGNAVVRDGHPVYVHDDGKEAPFDAAAAMQAIRERNREAKAHRERAQELESRLTAFDGIEPDAARKALDTLGNVEAGKLVEAGKVEQLKADISRSYEAKLAEATRKASDIEQRYVSEMVGGAFARSKFLADRTVLPPDLAQAAFGQAFRVEDGAIRAYDREGNAIMSRAKPGAYADFDEAIETLVDQYPRKDQILRADQRPGSGAPAGSGGSGAGQRLTRQQFDAMAPKERAAAMQSGAQLID
jgi:hypothetical protein